jgi:hypothetical protein
MNYLKNIGKDKLNSSSTNKRWQNYETNNNRRFIQQWNGRINIQDAILFAQSKLIDTEEKLEREKLSNNISKDAYDYMKKDNIRRSKIFEELRIKIENTPRCKV